VTHDFLTRLRVVESSAFIAAPLAGLTLSQFGADVIRVDLIGGGIDYGRLPLMPSGRSLYWTGLNKGKRSIAIDIRRPEGRDLVRALATAPGPDAGVLLTNIGTPWLAHDSLAALRPDMVTCTIQGNADGSTALDYTVNCATGYPFVTGGATPDKPVNHVLPTWDMACAYQAAFAVLAAVTRRRRSGEGAELRIALSDIAFAMLSHLGVTAETELLDQERPSIGNHIYGAFGRDFGTADGRRVMVAAISSGQWSALVKACAVEGEMSALERSMGLDFSRETGRFEARDAIAALIEPWFAARSLSEVAQALDAHGACWGLYRGVRELLAQDKRVSLANPMFEQLDTPGVGRHMAAGSPVRVGGSARAATRPAPLLGADTDQVLHEVLGLDGAAIGRLHDAGVVAGPERDPTVAASR
jgi:2-methylfumaryl-CoA isomerase